MSQKKENFSDEDLVKRIRGEVVVDEARVDDVQPTYYVTDDEKLLIEINEDANLRNLKPLYSRLMRLTKISTRDKEVFQTDVDLLIGEMIIDMDEDKFNMGNGGKLEAHGIFLKTAINDSHKGFKMTLLSRLRKEIVVTEEKRKGFWRR